MAYSRSVVTLIVGLIDDDEAYVLGPRRARPLVNVKTGYLAAPKHRSHPSRRIFMEEIYYAYLLFRELRNSSRGDLLLVDEPMHEIASKSVVYPADHPTQDPTKHARFPLIYHKLKHPSHFQLLENTSYLLRPVSAETPYCERLGARWRGRVRRAMYQQGWGDTNWTRCRYPETGEQDRL